MARLGISTIDCLIIHDVDVWTHGSRAAYQERFREAMEGSYRVLTELREQGVIKAIGVGLNGVGLLHGFRGGRRF